MLFRPHPVLGWELTPNGRVRVGFRRNVTQKIGSDGSRRVTGVIKTTDTALVFYGCSFTYGTGLKDDETFASIIQSELPSYKIVNRGVGGYGTLQNLLQFRHDIRNSRIETAVFGILSDHRYRNIPHPQRMQQFQNPEWHALGVEHIPTVAQDREGLLKVNYIPIWQPSLRRNDFEVFMPNEHMIDQATFCVLDEILNLARSNNVRVILALLDQLDPQFNAALVARYECAVDVSVPLDTDHTFLPLDVHPNAVANRLFANRLSEPIAKVLRTASESSD